MPRLPIDYSKTIIYRIVCKNPEIKDCYVGQTTDFTSRKSCHKVRVTILIMKVIIVMYTNILEQTEIGKIGI